MMEAVILAAGMGSRFKSLNHPKGMLQPKGLQKSLMQRSIEILKKSGISKIIVGIGYKKEIYLDFFDTLQSNNCCIVAVENPYFYNGSSSDTLKVLVDYISDDFLLLESDLLYESRAILSLLQDSKRNIILVSEISQRGDEVFVELRKNRVSKMSKNINKLQNIYGEFVGISKISKNYLQKFKFGEHRDYESLLLGMGAKKIVDLIWCEIDDEKHLELAERIVVPKLDII